MSGGRVACLLILALLLSLPASAEEATLEAGVFGGLPSALETGQLLGGSVGASWRLDNPLELGAHLDVGRALESNFTFEIEHVETRLMVFASAVLDLGAGALAASLGGGLVWVHETRSRHETGRVERAGLAAVERSNTVGPILALDVSVRLHIFGDFSASLGAGPSLSWVTVSSELEQRLGWSGRIAAVYRLW